MQNIEVRSLSDEVWETQRVRSLNHPLKIVNNIEKMLNYCTNTNKKELICLSGMVGVAIIGSIVDGNFGIVASESLAVFGGAMSGNDIPIVSGPIDFFQEKKEIKKIRKERIITVEEMANLLLEYPDAIEKEEIEWWTKKRPSGDSLDHPDRYKLFMAILENNQESAEIVANKFFLAEILAQQIRRSEEYMRKEASKKLINMLTGIAITTGLTNALIFGLSLQSEAGWIGLVDDGFSIISKESRHIKNGVKSFFSKF